MACIELILYFVNPIYPGLYKKRFTLGGGHIRIVKMYTIAIISFTFCSNIVLLTRISDKMNADYFLPIRYSTDSNDILRPTSVIPRINKIEFRIKSWRFRIISRNFLVIIS